MNKPHSPIEKKSQRKKRFKLDVHLRIGEFVGEHKKPWGNSIGF